MVAVFPTTTATILWIVVLFSVEAITTFAIEKNHDGGVVVEKGVDRNQRQRQPLAYHRVASTQSFERLVNGSNHNNNDDENNRAEETKDDVFVLLFYHSDCTASNRLQTRFREAYNRILLESSSSLSSASTTFSAFLELPVVTENKELLDVFSVTKIPHLVFVKRQHELSDDDGDNERYRLYQVDYVGLQSTVEELVQGFNFYATRMQHSRWYYFNSPTTDDHEHSHLSSVSLQSLVWTVSSLQELQDNIITKLRPPQRDEDNTIPPTPPSSSSFSSLLFQPTKTPLDPHLSRSEQDSIRFLLQEELFPDPSYVVCQCRQQNSNKHHGDDHQQDNAAKYLEFDQLAYRLSLRRNVLFSIVRPPNCSDDDEYEGEGGDGAVTIYPVNEHEHEHNALFGTPIHVVSVASSLSTTLMSTLRPSVLWLDRQTTAPIAFDPQYQVHAVLFVDFHHWGLLEEMQSTIEHFRRECQEQQKDSSSSFDMVCLVVPSTDTRVLTTFGIDMWTRLDQQAVSFERIQTRPSSSSSDQSTSTTDNANLSPVLPALLITDQRDGLGIRRYYLDPPLVVPSSAGDDNNMKSFFRSFWDGRLVPETKTSSSSSNNNNNSCSEQNSHHVHLLSSTTLESFLLQQPQPQQSNNTNKKKKHSLVLLYAPTCGHCKRFNIIWNALGDLLHYLDWDETIGIQIGRLDVSTNEWFYPGMAAHWLPDVYYFGPPTSSSSSSNQNDSNSNSSRSRSLPIPIVYTGRTEHEDEVGGVSDPLELIEWFLDVADNIDEQALLQDLKEKVTTTTRTEN